MARIAGVDLPRDKLIVVTGVSGSGKSSLAFDTVYAEGQRRLLASMSTFAKRFVGQLKKPDVDFVNGLSPVVSIDQKTVGSSPRSTFHCAPMPCGNTAAKPRAAAASANPNRRAAHAALLIAPCSTMTVGAGARRAVRTMAVRGPSRVSIRNASARAGAHMACAAEARATASPAIPAKCARTGCHIADSPSRQPCVEERSRIWHPSGWRGRLSVTSQ